MSLTTVITILTLFFALGHQVADAETQYRTHVVSNAKPVEESLQEDVYQLKQTVQLLIQANIEHERKFELLQLEKDERINDLQEQIDDLQLNLRKITDADLVKESASPVAFSYYAANTVNYNNGDTVKFESLVSNIGSSYDPDSSVFECPSDGIYLFSISLQSEIREVMWGNIVKNGEVLLSSRSDNENDVQSTVIVVTECLATESVYVLCSGDDRQIIGGNRSSFSGVLITPYV